MLHSGEIGVPQPVPGSPVHLPVSRVLAVAERVSQEKALRHKRHGTWLAWSWAGLATQVERLGQALRARGIGAGSLVVVSGQYGPNLLLFALAAAHQGARVMPIPINAKRAALAEWLTRNGPDIAFLGQRDQLGTWRGALDQTGRTAVIVVDFHLPWGHPSGTGFSFAVDLLGASNHGATPARPSSDVLWIEESTDWADGLSYVLHAAASGRALAFPESRIAAGRDRVETQPAAITLSPEHHAALARDLSARLPTGGTLAARLTRLALDAGRRGSVPWHHRQLLARLRRPLGLARLRDLTVVATDGQTAASEAANDLFSVLGIRSGYARLPPETVPSSPTAQPRLAFA